MQTSHTRNLMIYYDTVTKIIQKHKIKDGDTNEQRHEITCPRERYKNVSHWKSHDQLHVSESVTKVSKSIKSKMGIQMSRATRKPVLGVFDQVGHKPGCTTTEDG